MSTTDIPGAKDQVHELENEPATVPSVTTTPLATDKAEPLSPTTAQQLKQAQFDAGPSTAPISRIQHTSLSHSPDRANSGSSARASSSTRAGVPTPPIHPTTPQGASLIATVHDLRTLLKSFLVFIPSSLRRLRFLLPSPLLRLARATIERAAMTLHKRGALASNVFFDVLVVLWTTMIHLFFREIRSRGAWKIPRDGEGAIIFVVGPHHNQVSTIHAFSSQFAFPHDLLSVFGSTFAHFGSATRGRTTYFLPCRRQIDGQKVRRHFCQAHAVQFVFFTSCQIRF